MSSYSVRTAVSGGARRFVLTHQWVESLVGFGAALSASLLQDWWLIFPAATGELPDGIRELEAHDPIGHEWPWLIAMSLPLLLARRHPLSVLAASSAIYMGAWLNGVFLLPVSPLIALATVIVHVRAVSVVAWACVLMGVLWSGLIVAVKQHGQHMAIPVYTLAIALLAGLTLRSRRQRGEAEALARQVAADKAWVDARLTIAREMHDLVGHGLSATAIQSTTARVALTAGDPQGALRAIEAVEAGSRETLDGLRELLTVLRADGPSGRGTLSPAPSLEDLPRLIEDLRRAGIPVQLRTSGPLGATPGQGLCLFRVVQEALTNALRHAPGTDVRVTLSRSGTRIIARVENGPPAAPAGAVPPSAGAGLGLRGMRERVEALGGRLSAGQQADGGWVVRAGLPIG